MARGIEIPLVADVAPFLSGMGKAADAVEDLADVFDDTSKAADDTADRVDTAMRDTARSGEDAAEKVERSWKDALSELQDRARRLDREDVKVDVDVDVDKSKRKLDGFRDDLASSANQSGQEIAGTFTAGFDAENIADGITEILAESTENLSGPMQAAGIGAAAAFALLYGELSKVAEAINTAKTEAGEMAVEMGKLDDQGRLEALQGRFDELSTTLIDVRSWFEVWQDDAVTSIEAIAGAVRSGTLDAQAFGDAFYQADPTERLAQLRDVQEDLNRKLDEAGSMSFWEKLGASAAASEGITSAQEDLNRSMSDNVKISEDARAVLEDLIAEQEAAVEIQRAQAEAAGLTVEQFEAQQEATARATEAQQAYVQALEDTADPVSTYQGILDEKTEKEREAAEATAAATEDATDSWEDYAKAAKVTVGDLIETWNEQAAAAREFETNLAIIAASGGQALADELRAKGPEVAGAVAEVIAEAGPEKRAAAIAAHAKATGEDISTDMGQGVRDNAGAVQQGVNDAVNGVTAPSVPVPFTFDGWQAQQALNTSVFSLRPPSIRVPMTFGEGRDY